MYVQSLNCLCSAVAWIKIPLTLKLKRGLISTTLVSHSCEPSMTRYFRDNFITTNNVVPDILCFWIVLSQYAIKNDSLLALLFILSLLLDAGLA